VCACAAYTASGRPTAAKAALTPTSSSSATPTGDRDVNELLGRFTASATRLHRRRRRPAYLTPKSDSSWFVCHRRRSRPTGSWPRSIGPSIVVRARQPVCTLWHSNDGALTRLDRPPDHSPLQPVPSDSIRSITIRARLAQAKHSKFDEQKDAPIPSDGL
jgi:hypothetical protein